MSNPRERRRHFRLRFPRRDRPVFESTAGKFEIIEASEEGLRLGAAVEGTPGEVLAGTLRFRQGPAIPIQATLLRVERSETVFHQVRGLTTADMLREQRRLMSRYLVADFLLPPRGSA